MGTINLPPHPDFTSIRWTLDAAEPLDELDDIDLDGIANPLAAPLVAVLRANRRLLQRLTHAAEIVKAGVELLHTRHLEIERLERQVRTMRDELRRINLVQAPAQTFSSNLVTTCKQTLPRRPGRQTHDSH